MHYEHLYLLSAVVRAGQCAIVGLSSASDLVNVSMNVGDVIFGPPITGVKTPRLGVLN